MLFELLPTLFITFQANLFQFDFFNYFFGKAYRKWSHYIWYDLVEIKVAKNQVQKTTVRFSGLLNWHQRVIYFQKIKNQFVSFLLFFVLFDHDIVRGFNLEELYGLSDFTRTSRPSNFGPERSKNVPFRVPERCWAVQLGSKNGWCSFSAWMKLIFILQFYYNPSSFYLTL